MENIDNIQVLIHVMKGQSRIEVWDTIYFKHLDHSLMIEIGNELMGWSDPRAMLRDITREDIQNRCRLCLFNQVSGLVMQVYGVRDV